MTTTYTTTQISYTNQTHPYTPTRMLHYSTVAPRSPTRIRDMGIGIGSPSPSTLLRTPLYLVVVCILQCTDSILERWPRVLSHSHTQACPSLSISYYGTYRYTHSYITY